MHLPSLAQRLTSERNQAAAATHNNTHRFSRRTQKVNGIFNLAGNSPISMRDLAFLVVEVVGHDTATVDCSGKIDFQENHRAHFDVGRAKELLKWNPTISLRQGIAEWAGAIGRKIA